PEPAAPGAIDVTATIPTPQSFISQTGAPPRRSRLRSWLLIGASAVVLCCITAFTLRAHWSRERFARAANSTIQSIAVLPLDNLSGDPAQDYFADGMTDELTTMLAKDSTLRITSRTSAMQYKRAHEQLPEIARALNVDGILEGSVQRSGNQVHVTLQLIQADSDTHLWAESYDRNLNDLSSLPDDVAQQIAKLLHQSATAAKQAHYVNPEAHDAYL